MRHELRVPVARLDARLYTDDGVCHEVTLFLPPGAGIEHIIEAAPDFVPVSEEGKIRIFARSALAAVAVRSELLDAAPTPEDEFLTESRALRVRLRGGAVIDGALRHSRCQPRTADLLNDPAPTVALSGDGMSYRIAKAHIACVDEVYA